MELKVRAMTEVENKSKQEIENELLKKHEEEQQQDQEEPPTIDVKNIDVDPEPKTTVSAEKKSLEEKEDKPSTGEPPEEADAVEKKEEEIEKVAKRPYDELKEEDVLSYIEKRYGKQINSLEELTAEREAAEELPPDVAAYFKYKKETGRSMSDYIKLQKDYSGLDGDSLLREYYSITEEGLDSEDINLLMEDFSFDEEIDEPLAIKKTKLAKKKEIAKAKKFFNQQQELYKQPLESRESSATANEELIAYRQYVEEAKAQQDVNTQKSQWFSKKSTEVFSPEFKGFKFKIDDGTTMVYTPGSASELKKAQESPYNFVSKYLDSNGFLKDAEGYHKSLAIAMNPDKFARHFYEQGKAEATEDVMRKTKNINMTERRAPEAVSKGGFQVKSVSQPSSRGLKIKSIKKS